MPGLLARVRSRKSVIVFCEILALLAGEARRRAVALELIEMARRAADRADNAFEPWRPRPSAATVAAGLAREAGEVGGKRLQIVLAEIRRPLPTS